MTNRNNRHIAIESPSYIDVYGITKLLKQVKANGHVKISSIKSELSIKTCKDRQGYIDHGIRDRVLKDIKKVFGRRTCLKDMKHFEDIDEASKYILNNKKQVSFLKTDTFFDVPQYYFYNSRVSFVDAVNSSRVIFYNKNINCKYDYNDKYYRNMGKPAVVMPSILDNYVQNYKYFRMGGKDTMIINIFHGKDIPLKVYGAMYFNKSCLEIKPYVICFML